MSTANSNDRAMPFINALRQLQLIRNFDGEPSKFWQMLLEALMGLSGAEAGLICLRLGEDLVEWKTLAMGPQTPLALNHCKALTEAAPLAAKGCAQKGYVHLPNGKSSIIAVNLLVDADTQKCLALFHVDTAEQNDVVLRINSLLAANDIPAQYRVQQTAFDALKNQSHLTDILDLMTLINGHRRFLAAAMTLCNELATRYGCDRVSLGWLKGGYVRVKAMSHTDNFEKKMEALQQLELAMEEALDQEADLVFPPAEGCASIIRDHEAYAKAHDVQYMATLALRKEDAIVALCTFERSKAPFSETDLRHLRVALDQLATRLAELKHRDRWFGARFTDWMRDHLSRILGYEHTWAKFGAIAGALALMVISFIPVRYRVSSPMILRTDDVSYITAPFDGYIDSVGVKPGDLVTTDHTLLSLDKKDLLLEEASLMAEKNREGREIEKARAAGELADMCIAQARFDQVAAKLDIALYKLDQAAIVSPFDGVVIEGDQLEKIGSPVKQGEILFKIGKLKNVYAESKVSEAEIQNIKTGTKAQIALASRPQEPFDVVVTLVEPSAVVNEKDNVFLVRSTFKQAIPTWFRPGMTGVSKINAGRKTILWIISHRTIDFLRLKLWW
jgi:multidrug resistance efflux pump